MKSLVWLTTASEHLRARGRLVLVLSLLAFAARMATPPPPERSVEEIAAMLGRESGGSVQPDQFIWEPRGGILSDAILGRRVLFLASLPTPDGSSMGDLFRARVRLTRSGRAMSLHGLRNLTSTPLGDDRELVARGRYVAFTTSAYGAVQGVTMLDLAGDRADREARTSRERAQAAIESWIDTGTLDGVGRTEVVFSAPPPDVKLEMTESALLMALGDEARTAAIEPESGALNTGDANPFLARAQRLPHPVRPLAPFIVEVVQNGLGGRPARALGSVIASLEGLQRRERESARKSEEVRRPNDSTVAHEAPPTEALSVNGWPPTPLATQVSPAWPGEGAWGALRSPLLPQPKPRSTDARATGVPPTEPQEASADSDAGVRQDAGAEASDDASIGSTGSPSTAPTSSPPTTAAEQQPTSAPPPPTSAPAFFETTIRPDPSQPQASVRIVAMDMRQLELRMEAGFDEPRPAAGPRGSGRLPTGPAATRVVAAFAGGRPPINNAVSPAQAGASPIMANAGEVGMVVERRILVPPVPGVFTFAVEHDGRAAFGPWPFSGPIPESIVSLRQSPVPLLQNGALVASTHAASAPRSADRAAEIAERAALCVTPEGHALYAWSAGASTGSLAKALALAGCASGAHLGVTPARSGFALVRLRAKEGLREEETLLADGNSAWDVELLTPAMSLPPERLSNASPSEIFYLMTRDPAPRAPLSIEGAEWAPDSGHQPPPAWIPAVFIASVTNLGARVRLTAFAPDRFAWRVRAGIREPSRRKGSLPGVLDPGEQERVAAAIALGVARRKGGPPRGLSIGSAEAFPIRSGAGALVASDRGLAILRSGELPAERSGDVVELPLTADDGKLLPEGRRVGSRRARAAACILEDGTLLVATTTFDSDEATTEALLDAGCARIIALDRGSHHPAFVHRAGTEMPPLPRYESSALYAIELPMRGRAHSFEEASPTAPSPARAAP